MKILMVLALATTLSVTGCVVADDEPIVVTPGPKVQPRPAVIKEDKPQTVKIDAYTQPSSTTTGGSTTAGPTLTTGGQ